MKARLRAFTAAILMLVAASGALRAHPIHTSVAEADYNATSGNLEVALRVFIDTSGLRAVGYRMYLFFP